MPAVTVSDDGDASAEGRRAPACATCHYEGLFPLDPFAAVLDRKDPTSEGQNISFLPGSNQAQMLLGERISNVNELVTMLSKRPEFFRNACRLSFEFLWGRSESTAELPLVESCTEVFKSSGLIQDTFEVFSS